jgi:hypothetical protein
MCIIPMQIVIDVTWGTELPGFAAMHPKPLKRLLLALVTAVGLACGFGYYQIGGRRHQPAHA